jgi:hypothetical protein
VRRPNDLLRRARLGLTSPSGSGRQMSRQELAEAVNAYLFATTERASTLDGSYVGKLERGEHRWPCAVYRQAFRAVLGKSTDAELGFYIARRNNDAAIGHVSVAASRSPPGPLVPGRTGLLPLVGDVAVVYLIVASPESGPTRADRHVDAG